jgi:hypothetical protein
VIAFVDESVRRSHLGTYAIGVVPIPAERCHELRSALSKLPLFHFNGADAAHKAAMFERISQWGLETGGYYLRGLFQVGGEEEARKHCLKRLLLDLKDWGVHELILESRRERQNTFDAINIIASARAGLAPDPINYDWRPKAERLLVSGRRDCGGRPRSSPRGDAGEPGSPCP